MAPSLADLTSAAATATEPSLVTRNKISPGGVDPLGLRQINFDLMDQVLPGLNNVARHIRPFVVTTWAWRRARQLAQAGEDEEVDADSLLRDFVDRIEVIYAWSQFLRNANADLPGRQVLTTLVEADRWEFGGKQWKRRREERRYSTAFTAAITYGPGLKTFGWVRPHRKLSEVLIPMPECARALDAFERKLAPFLAHPAFSKLGTVSVDASDVRQWADAWAIDRPTVAEKEFMAAMLLGQGAPAKRRQGCQLMLAAAEHVEAAKVDTVRREALAWGDAPLPEFLKHVFESWILAQHLYWAVGRGLADARSTAGKRILRLRVVLEEQGWALTPGTSPRGRPAPSEDRLRTAMSLAAECGHL